MEWVYGVLAPLCLAVGGLHLVRLVRRRRDVVLEGGYAVMALSMAAMFSPIGDPVPAPVWTTLLLLSAGWFGGLMVRARSVGVCGGEAAHLVVAAVAMVFMFGRDAYEGGGMPADGHAAHLAGTAGMAGLSSAIALGLAAYFVLHTLRCADRLLAVRSTAGGCSGGSTAVEPAAAPTGTVRRGTVRRSAAPPRDGTTAIAVAVPEAAVCSPRIAAVAHLVVTVAMAVMLIAMI